MNKFKFIISASIASILTLSCSDDKDEPENISTESNLKTVSYPLQESQESYFTYLETSKYEYCDEGELKSEDYPGEIIMYYSINDDTLTLTPQGFYSDELKFNGTSNSLVGTWTRTKDKTASCDYYGCKDGYDITKMVFTTSTVDITREVCPTDAYTDGEEDYSGWVLHIVDCNTLEKSKNSTKVTQKIIGRENDRDKYTYIYNGKSCSEIPSESEKKAACKKAFEENEYYEGLLDKDFDDCMEKNMPAEFLDN